MQTAFRKVGAQKLAHAALIVSDVPFEVSEDPRTDLEAAKGGDESQHKK
jgi:hypothetical protein